MFLRGHASDSFRLEVEDRGRGVDPSLVPQLFERFTRGDHDRRAGLAGAGLGLAIAASFASPRRASATRRRRRAERASSSGYRSATGRSTVKVDPSPGCDRRMIRRHPAPSSREM